MMANLPQTLLVNLVRGYRLLLSPWLGSSCRFTPSCSAYSLQALQLHGAAQGGWLTLKRIGRCRPGCPGGHDPVPMPEALNASGHKTLFTSLISQEKTSP
jgi:uncharacterized protein